MTSQDGGTCVTSHKMADMSDVVCCTRERERVRVPLPAVEVLMQTTSFHWSEGRVKDCIHTKQHVCLLRNILHFAHLKRKHFFQKEKALKKSSLSILIELPDGLIPLLCCLKNEFEQGVADEGGMEWVV